MNQVIEVAEKTPQLIKLKAQCQEIANGSRKVISKEVIDDAFEAFGTIIRNLGKSSEEENELQKFITKYYFCNFLRKNNIIIN